MAKVSQYQEMTGLTGGERLLGVQNTGTKVVTLDDVAAYAAVEAGAVTLHAVEQLVDPKVDADALVAGTGAGMVGFAQQAAGAVVRTLLSKSRETVTPFDFGAIADGSQDASAAFQAASDSGSKRIYVPSGIYAIANSVFVPAGVTFLCDPRGVTFKPIAGGSFNGGFMFLWNTEDGITWQDDYPNINSGGIENAIFWNYDNLPAQRGIYAFAPINGRNLRFVNFRQAIKKPSGFYIDSFNLESVLCEAVQDNSEYQVELLGTGDGLVLRDVHCPYDSGKDESILAVRVRGSVGGVLDACIGGDYLFESCTSMSVRGGHFEKAQHIIDSSSVTYDATSLYGKGRPSIVGRGDFASVTGTERSVISLRDVSFVTMEAQSGSGAEMYYSPADVQIDATVALHVDNSFRKWTVNGAITKSQIAGIKVCNASGDPLSAWNNYSYAMSVRGRIGPAYLVSNDFVVHQTSNSFTGISSGSSALENISAAISAQWRKSAGTYYYTAQVLYDPVRLIGRNQTAAEFSISVPDTSKAVRLVVDFNGKPRAGIVRLYRGTSAGSYDSYVDIHTTGSVVFYDNGDRVNGHDWVSRTAGAVTTINAGLSDKTLMVHGDTVTLHASTIPSSGSWTHGDYVVRMDTAVDANNMRLKGHFRASTGSGHVSGTDWINERTSTVSPAT